MVKACGLRSDKDFEAKLGDMYAHMESMCQALVRSQQEAENLLDMTGDLVDMYADYMDTFMNKLNS